MGVQLSDAFTLYSQVPLDERTQYESIAEMAAVDDYKLYDGIMATIKGDVSHTVYQWFSDNPRASELGKWRRFNVDGEGGALTTESVTSKVNVGGISFGTEIPRGTEITDFIKMLIQPDAIYPSIDAKILMADGEEPCYPGPYIEGTTLDGGTILLAPTYDETTNRTMNHVDFYYQLAGREPVFDGRVKAEEVEGYEIWSHHYLNLRFTTNFKIYAVIYYVDAEGTLSTQTYSGDYTFVKAAYYGIVNSIPPSGGEIMKLDTVALNTKEFKWTHVEATNAYPCYAYPSSRGGLVSIKDSNAYEFMPGFTVRTAYFNGTYYNVYYLKNATTLDEYSFHFE